MTRRSVLVGLAALVATPLFASKPDSIARANEFALAYREWGALYENRNPGELDAREIRAWKLLKEKFNALRKHIDLEYEAN